MWLHHHVYDNETAITVYLQLRILGCRFLVYFMYLSITLCTIKACATLKYSSVISITLLSDKNSIVILTLGDHTEVNVISLFLAI